MVINRFWLGDPNAHIKSGKKLWITSDHELKERFHNANFVSDK